MMNRLLIVTAVIFTTIAGVSATRPAVWTASEMDELQSMSLAALDPLPADPTNRVADNPLAAELGRKLFFDTRLSANGKVSCGSCHQPERDFEDGLALAKGVGTTSRRTMPVAGAARAPFLFWDGRKDSLWAQALGPLESPVEHGGTREQYARIIADNYAAEYRTVFGPLPDASAARRDDITRVFVNMGKAIAAYERQVEFGRSRFDDYVDALSARRPVDGLLTADEVAGLRLFVGKANCTRCHNGPAFTNYEFHNTGVPARPGLAKDEGRFVGASSVLKDEFNCRSQWSDSRDRCTELDVMISGDKTQQRAYKVPSLRNVAGRAPYMHAGHFATLDQVLDHYNRAPVAPQGESELEPLGLKPSELRQLEAFLRSLSARPHVAETAR